MADVALKDANEMPGIAITAASANFSYRQIGIGAQQRFRPFDPLGFDGEVKRGSAISSSAIGLCRQ